MDEMKRFLQGEMEQEAEKIEKEVADMEAPSDEAMQRVLDYLKNDLIDLRTIDQADRLGGAKSSLDEMIQKAKSRYKNKVDHLTDIEHND